jgi:hypothetical protein
MSVVACFNTALQHSPRDSVQLSEIPSEDPKKLRNFDLGLPDLNVAWLDFHLR